MPLNLINIVLFFTTNGERGNQPASNMSELKSILILFRGYMHTQLMPISLINIVFSTRNGDRRSNMLECKHIENVLLNNFYKPIVFFHVERYLSETAPFLPKFHLRHPIDMLYTWPGSNWRPSACEADVIATRPQVLARASF